MVVSGVMTGEVVRARRLGGFGGVVSAVLSGGAAVVIAGVVTRRVVLAAGACGGGAGNAVTLIDVRQAVMAGRRTGVRGYGRPLRGGGAGFGRRTGLRRAGLRGSRLGAAA